MDYSSFKLLVSRSWLMLLSTFLAALVLVGAYTVGKSFQGSVRGNLSQMTAIQFDAHTHNVHGAIMLCSRETLAPQTQPVLPATSLCEGKGYPALRRPRPRLQAQEGAVRSSRSISHLCYGQMPNLVQIREAAGKIPRLRLP